MYQNLLFALVYNTLGVPIATGVLYQFRWYLALAAPCGGGDVVELGLSREQRAECGIGLGSDARVAGEENNRHSVSYGDSQPA